MRVKQGKQYSTEESMQLDMSLADIKADMSVVTLQVRRHHHEPSINTIPSGRAISFVTVLSELFKF